MSDRIKIIIFLQLLMLIISSAASMYSGYNLIDLFVFVTINQVITLVMGIISLYVVAPLFDWWMDL